MATEEMNDEGKASAKLKKLWCIRTHGRWCRGDVASFEGEQAEKMLKAKGTAWVGSQAAYKKATEKPKDDS
jgi:hypothetical protein